MEPFKVEVDRYRLICNLGKYPVINVIRGSLGTRFTIRLPNGVTLTPDLPLRADINVGDVLTLYTEVFYAPPDKPPI